MREPVYGVDDVVLSVAGPIVGYGARLSNQLCIIRGVVAYDEAECPAEDTGIVYECTTLATGELVELYENEIVDEHRGDNP